MDMSLADERLRLVRGRVAAADGSFVYSVRSTGVYCRPSCASRQARAENVAFHADCAAAEAAGFRACQRCDPRGERDVMAAVVECCRRIDAAEDMPDLASLAAAGGYSAAHFHRLFKARTGFTPRRYAAFRRAERLRAELAAAGSVTQALYAAGYNASSRFYAEAGALLGMAPAAARRGGDGEVIEHASGVTRFGVVLAARTAAGVCHIALGEAAAPLQAELRRRFPRAELVAAGTLAGVLAEAVALVEQGGTAEGLPLDLRGTAFQLKVWDALRRIAPGQVVSYAQLAEAVGARGSARAVAGACAANQVAVAVPCHRVVRGDGALSGYRWGVARKRGLLAAEGTAMGAGSTGSANRRAAATGPVRRNPS